MSVKLNVYRTVVGPANDVRSRMLATTEGKELRLDGDEDGDVAPLAYKITARD